MGDSVWCAPTVLETIREHARRDAPRECCGLLVARGDCIEEAVPAHNRAADPTRRYDIEPRDYLAAVKRCRGTSAMVVGAYHSHPGSAPVPSETDRAEAFGEFLYLIAGPVAVSVPVEIVAYRLCDGNFRTVRLVPPREDPQT